MKILLLGCHSILEFDLMKMFTEIDDMLPQTERMNIEIFSLEGAYQNPLQSGDFTRSIIPKGRFYHQLYSVAMQCSKDNIHPELLDWCDVVFFMHNSAIPGQKEQQRWVVRNWKLIQEKKKKSIWYSIGQSTPAIEVELKKYFNEGLQIIRYSPLETFIPEYAGASETIRFYKDDEEFKGWNGEKIHVITLAQSYMKRGDHLGFSLFERVTSGFNRRVFGNGNEDLGDLWAGNRSYEELKKDLRDARCFFYTGTIPAPYTLSFIEAMMTGIPIIAIGSELRKHSSYPWKNYEIPNIISNGVNGYISDNIDELRNYIQLLFDNGDVAKRVGEAGRRTAIELFGKKNIYKKWIDFLKKM